MLPVVPITLAMFILSATAQAQMACSPNGASAFVDIPLRMLKCAGGVWEDWVPGSPSIAAGAPAAGDCDSNLERGRFAIDTTFNLLYVCNGAIRGWDHVVLVP